MGGKSISVERALIMYFQVCVTVSNHRFFCRMICPRLALWVLERAQMIGNSCKMGWGGWGKPWHPVNIPIWAEIKHHLLHLSLGEEEITKWGTFTVRNIILGCINIAMGQGEGLSLYLLWVKPLLLCC